MREVRELTPAGNEPPLEETGLSPEAILEAAFTLESQPWFPQGRPVRAEYYAYSRIKSTIRIKADSIHLRISTILRGAPPAVLRALIHILLTRAHGQKPRQADLHLYNTYITGAEIKAKLAAPHVKTSRPGPCGRCFDLREIFTRVNQDLFQGRLSWPRLSWSARESRRRLGFFDICADMVVISRTLDHPDVPAQVVEFIMYHELLHRVLPIERKNGRRQFHSPHFRSLEKNFPEYEAVIDWIKNW